MTAALWLLWWAAQGAVSVPAKPTVWLFVRTDCPIANRYAPTVERIYRTYSAKGIEFRLIYPEPGVTSAMLEKHRSEYGLSIAALADPRQEYVRMAQASVTPEAVVWVAGRMIYRGRIDDRHASLVQTRRAPTQNDLADVLDAVSRGRTPAFRATHAIGCAIERLP